MQESFFLTCNLNFGKYNLKHTCALGGMLGAYLDKPYQFIWYQPAQKVGWFPIVLMVAMPNEGKI
uniref:Uncharacterized protein n=1 Tax=Romanomermis culicivorax TaxID=13658 RepID=A0A915IHT5_ROMCU